MNSSVRIKSKETKPVIQYKYKIISPQKIFFKRLNPTQLKYMGLQKPQSPLKRPQNTFKPVSLPTNLPSTASHNFYKSKVVPPQKHYWRFPNPPLKYMRIPKQEKPSTVFRRPQTPRPWNPLNLLITAFRNKIKFLVDTITR